MMNYELDCTDIRSLAELHSELARILSFPEYYGANFDALFDCLTDTVATLHILNWDSLEANLGLPRCVSFRHVLQDAAEESAFSYYID